MLLKTVAAVSAKDILSPRLAPGDESVNQLRNIFFLLSLSVLRFHEIELSDVLVVLVIFFYASVF